jgi:hypothetical protein
MADEREFQRRLSRIESLVQSLETCADPEAREGARELVRALLDLHTVGLEKMLQLAAEPGECAMDRFAADGLVGSLLLLHGLHPVPLADRVARSLARLQASGPEVKLLDATEQAVRVLLGDSCGDAALRRTIEEAILAVAPDVLSVTFEEASDCPSSRRVALPLVSARATRDSVEV